jgi:predicted phosphodiesterase
VLLAGPPHPVTFEIAGFGPVVFCHGTPRDDDEVVLVDTRIERWAEVFAGLPQDVRTVVCGHTHMPFVRLVDLRLVINPGSVGMPYGRPG